MTTKEKEKVRIDEGEKGEQEKVTKGKTQKECVSKRNK